MCDAYKRRRITHHLSLSAVASPRQQNYHHADSRQHCGGVRMAFSPPVVQCTERVSLSDAAAVPIRQRSGKAMPFDNEFTLGIEEEFQIIDPVTRELRSRVNEMLEE